MLLRVDNLSKSFGIHDVLKDVTFFIETGDKIGLIGANGMGKSTLVKCLLGELEKDSGNIVITQGTGIGYLEQTNEMPAGNLWHVLLHSDDQIIRLRQELESLSSLVSVSKNEEGNEYLNRYQKTLETYERLQGYQYESLVRRVAFGLGFTVDDFEKPAVLFSGGQKTRIYLARALIKRPDLLILDEPTNHLDIQMIEWLEEYLQSYSGGLLIISHDRYFLDKVTNKIFYLHNTELQIFKGNFSAYLKQYNLQVASQLTAYEKQQEYIKNTEDYIRKYKAGIKSKQARGRQSKLERLKKIEKPTSTDSIRLQLPSASMCAEKVLILDKVIIGYDKPLVRDASLLLRRGERVAILGPNGSGKTSMLKSILGERKIMQGRIDLGNRVQIGYFSQEHEGLNLYTTILEEVMNAYSCTTEQARTLLGNILFRGDDVFKQISSLSGGERARLALLKLMLQGANFLILDEPTNHLDVNAREVLEEALAEFDGSLLVVSHDRYFLDNIINKVWEIEDQSIKEYLGNYSDYRLKKADNLRIIREAAEEAMLAEIKKPTQPSISVEQATNIPKSTSSTKDTRRRGFTDKDLAKVELKIREYEALRKVLEEKLSLPESHEDSALSASLANEHHELNMTLEKLMSEWEIIMSELEEN